MKTTLEQDLLAQEIAEKLKWDAEDISKVFLSALTDANFHSLRKELEPIINNHFKK